jgi:hypothetical protein
MTRRLTKTLGINLFRLLVLFYKEAYDPPLSDTIQRDIHPQSLAVYTQRD